MVSRNREGAPACKGLRSQPRIASGLTRAAVAEHGWACEQPCWTVRRIFVIGSAPPTLREGVEDVECRAL